MASIRKRGNSYLLVVSMGYTPDGRRRNPQQKTVKPPKSTLVREKQDIERFKPYLGSYKLVEDVYKRQSRTPPRSIPMTSI